MGKAAVLHTQSILEAAYINTSAIRALKTRVASQEKQPFFFLNFFVMSLNKCLDVKVSNVPDQKSENL